MALKIIVAIAENGVIGQKNGLPFRLADDMKHFKEKTVGCPVVMGSTTYFSLPAKFRPLPERENIVLTRSPEKLDGEKITVATSFGEILDRAKSENVWVMGGAEVYKQALSEAQELHLTRVLAQPDGDVLFPDWDKNEWMLVSSESHARDERNEHDFVWEVYKRR